MANAFMKRSGTMQIHSESKDLEIKVQKFVCHDETSMGKHHKKWDWTFSIGNTKQDWSVKVDEAMVGSNTLEFNTSSESEGNKQVFKNKLQQDFVHKLPVRGTLKLDKQYEVKSMNSSDQWYPATLTGARGDGKYEAEVLMPPDQYGNQKKVHYPIVEASRIRDPFSKKVVDIPSTMLQLMVKKDSALLPELTINNHAFTSYFCVPSPAANKPPGEINFEVNKERTMVKADVGHGKLKEAIDATKPGAKVRAKATKKSKNKCEWEIMIGAFGEHYIVAETLSKSNIIKDNKEITVTIDGNVVVGGSAADLGGNEWSADIAIQGCVMLKYKLFKTSSSGAATNDTKAVTKKLLRSNTIRITCPDTNNLQNCVLECDEINFGELEQYKPTASESNIDGSLETLESTHGISVPYAMDGVGGGGGIADDLAEFIPGGAGGLLNMFQCCQQPTVDDDSQVVIGSGSGAPADSSGNANWK